jgi:hypothetical protein
VFQSEQVPEVQFLEQTLRDYRAQQARDVSSGFPWHWFHENDSPVRSRKNIIENKCHTRKKEIKLKTLFKRKILHARFFFKY